MEFTCGFADYPKVGGAFGQPGGAIRADCGRMTAPFRMTRAGVPVTGSNNAAALVVLLAGVLTSILASAARAAPPPPHAEPDAEARFTALEHTYVVFSMRRFPVMA